MSRPIVLCNNNIKRMPVDILYHLGVSTESMDLKKAFGDVKFVIMGGSNKRMQKIAEILVKEFKVDLPVGTGLANISWTTDRYVMYKHGMGVPSISICLHEMAKLLHHAGATDVHFVRVGTSGGIGLKPGSVVITTSCMDCAFNDKFQLKVMGKVIERPAELDEDFIKGLVNVAEGMKLDFDVVPGKTMCADDFYEEQGRLDGAICDYTEEDKMAFLKEAHKRGVRNLEMESLGFAAFCQRLKIKAAVMCATIVNRLDSDQVSTPAGIMHSWQERPLEILITYMKKVLNTPQ